MARKSRTTAASTSNAYYVAYAPKPNTHPVEFVPGYGPTAIDACECVKRSVGQNANCTTYSWPFQFSCPYPVPVPPDDDRGVNFECFDVTYRTSLLSTLDFTFSLLLPVLDDQRPNSNEVIVAPILARLIASNLVGEHAAHLGELIEVKTSRR